MNGLDLFFAVVAIVSVLGGAWRGFVREAAALAGWVAAVTLVLNSARALGEWLPFGPASAQARTAIAAVLIVVACIVAAALLGRALRAALTAAELGGPDRALGALFGLVRAGAFALVVAAVALHTGLAQRPLWKSSRLTPWLEAALRFASPGFVPAVGWPMSAPGA